MQRIRIRRTAKTARPSSRIVKSRWLTKYSRDRSRIAARQAKRRVR